MKRRETSLYEHCDTARVRLIMGQVQIITAHMSIPSKKRVWCGITKPHDWPELFIYVDSLTALPQSLLYIETRFLTRAYVLITSLFLFKYQNTVDLQIFYLYENISKEFVVFIWKNLMFTTFMVPLFIFTTTK